MLDRRISDLYSECTGVGISARPGALNSERDAAMPITRHVVQVNKNSFCVLDASVLLTNSKVIQAQVEFNVDESNLPTLMDFYAYGKDIKAAGISIFDKVEDGRYPISHQISFAETKKWILAITEFVKMKGELQSVPVYRYWLDREKKNQHSV